MSESIKIARGRFADLMNALDDARNDATEQAEEMIDELVAELEATLRRFDTAFNDHEGA